MNLDWTSRSTTTTSKAYDQLERSVTDPITGEIFYWHSLALSAKANQEDYPTLREIRRMNDWEQDLWDQSTVNRR